MELNLYAHVLLAIMRYLGPILALVILLRCAWPLLTFRREPEIWAWLTLENGERLPITHWESVIGKSKRCDVVMNYPTVQRNHAVLIRYDDGSWTISDADSKTGITVNGEPVDVCEIQNGDQIGIGGVVMSFQPITTAQAQKLGSLRTKATDGWNSIMTLILLTALQMLTFFSFLLSDPGENIRHYLIGFLGLVFLQWALFMFYAFIRRLAFEMETLAFLLCTLGMAVICSVTPAEALKQLIAVGLGLVLFLLLGWSMRDLERAKAVRYLAAVAGVGLLVAVLIFGKEYYGAKNWLVIGGISLQPSELAKVCFVYVGASTIDRLMKKRNIILFIFYTLAVCGLLALMNDFGTALVFFFAFLMIAYLRSGSVGTVALACTALGFAGVIGLKIAPHAMRRLTAWRHIWEDPLDTGYQQTRALMCIASGGLFGLGIGQGKMKRIFAADSDMVFATVSEEWGLCMAVILVLCILVFALFALRSAIAGRSSFYVIGACTAAGILLVQTIFNVLGTLDVLPLTGITFPFLSNGGSSMMAAWGLLAFIKAADTRQNASFAVILRRERRRSDV